MMMGTTTRYATTRAGTKSSAERRRRFGPIPTFVKRTLYTRYKMWGMQM